jgi:iron-sulfur cluster assembly accessory protein
MAMEDVQQDVASVEMVQDGPALVISELAASKLADVLKERGLPNHGLRVFVHSIGCSGPQYGMAFENAPDETDIKIESHGVTLYLDPNSSQYMWGSQIDFVETAQGGAFSIQNPNTFESSCGSSGCSGCG